MEAPPGPAAVDEALRDLVERGVLSTEQSHAVREALARTRGGAVGSRWAEILGYIGGGLVLVGAVAFVAAWWDELFPGARAVLLAGATIALLAGAAAAAGGPRALADRGRVVPAARRRITGVLFALAAVTGSLAADLWLGGTPFLAGGLTGLALAAGGYALLPSTVGLVAAWGMSVVAVGSAVDLVRNLWWSEGLVLAWAFLALGLAWGALAAGGLLARRRTALGLAAAVALAGAQTPGMFFSLDSWGYGLTLALAAVLLAAYARLRSAVLLVFGVLGITVAVPQMVWDWTGGHISGPVVLLIAGAVLLAASWAGIRLHRPRRQPQS